MVKTRQWYGLIFDDGFWSDQTWSLRRNFGFTFFRLPKKNSNMATSAPTKHWKRGPRRSGFTNGAPPNPQPLKLCNYRLPASLAERLKDHAETIGVTQREIVETALLEYMTKRKIA